MTWWEWFAFGLMWGAVAFNGFLVWLQIRRSRQWRQLRNVQLELTAATFQMRHNPAAMRIIRDEMMRELRERS